MIADFAIHDKGDGNPHAHILLTMRAMDENGNLLWENEQLEKKLRSVNLDPDMVAQIKYRIGKVLDAGETPQHETTVQERLRTKLSSDKGTNLPEKNHVRKGVQGLEEC